MLAAARDAAETLSAEGIEATVWDVRVVPLDPAMIADAAEHPIVITIEYGILEGGVGSMAADAIAEHVTDAPPPRVRGLGISKEHPHHANADAKLQHDGLDTDAQAYTARDQVSVLRAEHHAASATRHLHLPLKPTAAHHPTKP